MKITKSITIDIEVWSDFTKKVEFRNYSATIQELIRAFNDTKENINIPKIQEKETRINELIGEVAKLRHEKKELEKIKQEQEKQTTFERPIDKWELARQKLAEERAKRYDKEGK